MYWKLQVLLVYSCFAAVNGILNLTHAAREDGLVAKMSENWIIPSDYDKQSQPKDPYLSIQITLSKLDIQESMQKCDVGLEFQISWSDNRLVYNGTHSVDDSVKDDTPFPSPFQRIWQPTVHIGTYANNELDDVEGVTVSDTQIKIERIELHESCVGCARLSLSTRHATQIISIDNYRHFPYDKHKCSMRVMTDVPMTRADVSWKKHESHPGFDIEIGSSQHQFKRLHYNSSEVDVNIMFNRRLESYVIRIYIPSGLFVFLTWLSMFLPPNTASDRVALCAATLLTITTFFNTATQVGPDVSYLRALDIWLLGSIGFVFLVLFENIAILRLTGRNFSFLKVLKDDTVRIEKSIHKVFRMHFRKEAKRPDNQVSPLADIEKGEATRVSPEQAELLEDSDTKVKTEMDGNKDSPILEYAKRVDRLFRMVLLGGIVVCNAVYWSWVFS